MIPTISHLFVHVRTYGFKHKPLYAISLLLLFFALFDGTLAYILPLIITDHGISRSHMGLILGSSSIAGASFDFILTRFLRNTNYRRLLFITLMLCGVYGLTLWIGGSVLMYLVAMFFWGLYSNLIAYSLFNFVSHEQKPEEHASSWGVLDIFKSLGHIIAPLIAGLTVSSVVGPQSFFIATFFLVISYMMYLLLLAVTKMKKIPDNQFAHGTVISNRRSALSSWIFLGRFLFPVLLFNTLLATYDAFFWIMGPLVSESLSSVHPFGGMFLTLYFLPSLMVGWFIGPITKIFGKKRTGYIGFIAGSLVTCIMGVFGLSPILLILVFIASTFSAISWPAIKGAFSDYVADYPEYEKEIETLTDFSGNIGYIIGPITAGFFAQYLGGDLKSLSIFGFVAAVVTLVLLKVTPRNIIIPRKGL